MVTIVVMFDLLIARSAVQPDRGRSLASLVGRYPTGSGDVFATLASLAATD